MTDWHIHHGDCIPHMAEVMEPESVDMAVFSPPFPSLYAYTSHEADIGNTDDSHLDCLSMDLRRLRSRQLGASHHSGTNSR